MSEINWDCYLDPPYDERAEHIVEKDGRIFLDGEDITDDFDYDFVRQEDEEIQSIVKTEHQCPCERLYDCDNNWEGRCLKELEKEYWEAKNDKDTKL